MTKEEILEVFQMLELDTDEKRRDFSKFYNPPTTMQSQVATDTVPSIPTDFVISEVSNGQLD